MYQENYIVTFRDVDRDYNINNHSLLQILQDVATKHLNDLGFDPMYLSRQNLAWVIYESKINLEKTKLYAHNIKINTFVINMKNIYSTRYFLIYDEDGTYIGYSVAKWVVIDTQKRSLTKIPADIVNKFLEEKKELTDKQKSIVDKKSIKPHKLDDVYKQKEFEIRYFDIDPNYHVNNTVYARLAVESLIDEDDFLAKHKVIDLEILYKKECPYDNRKVNIKYKLDNLTSYHEIYDEKNNLLSMVKLEFNEK